MRDKQQQTTEQTVKIELLSQWKLEAEFRNSASFTPDQQQIKKSNGEKLNILSELLHSIHSVMHKVVVAQSVIAKLSLQLPLAE